MATLDIRLLGGLKLEHGGAPVDLGPDRAKEVVAWLLLNRDRQLPRARLAYLLWPESDEAQARANLRKTLFQLRRALPEADAYVKLEGQHLQWRTDSPFELDVARFEAAAARAEQAAAGVDGEAQRTHLEEAVGLYRGDLLPEMYEPWLEDVRLHLRERFGRLLERLADLLERQRDVRAAVQHAQRLVQHDPFAETSHRRLMQLHVRCGERAKALHVYHSHAAQLRREMGLAPASETRALYEQVLTLETRAAHGTAAPAPSTGPTSVRSVFGVSPPLIGRRDELARLRALWQEVGAGQPALALVTGDSGVGKTRLVKEFVRTLPRYAATTLVSRCHAAEGALAFAPVTALLRSDALTAGIAELDPSWRNELGRLVPELAGGELVVAGPRIEQWQRTRLFEALARALLVGQPLVVVIDDLQWCDRDTLEWLHYLLRFDPGARLLVIGTARTHEIAGNAALVALIAALRDEGGRTELELGPLDAEETAALARSLSDTELSPAVLAMIYEQTEGNPLFVVEMLREGAIVVDEGRLPYQEPTLAALPPKLRSVIEARFERLVPATATLLGMAAVIGRTFDMELLSRVSGAGEVAAVRGLDDLWQHRIVREMAAGQYDFSHDKLREVAYASLSKTRRRLLHRYVAEALEALSAEAEEDGTAEAGVDASGRIAIHYDRAGMPERAIPHYQRAADAARALYANEEAASALRRALALVDGLPSSGALAHWRDEVAAHVLEGLGDVAMDQGAFDDAHVRFTQARERMPGQDRVGCARLWRKAAGTWIGRYAYDEAFASCQSAEAALGAPSAETGVAWWLERIELGLARANMHYWQLQASDIDAALESIRGAIERYGTPWQRMEFHLSLSGAGFIRDGFLLSSETLALVQAAQDAVEATRSAAAYATWQFHLGFALLWHGDTCKAEAVLVSSLRAAERVGNVVLRARCLTYLAFVARVRCDVQATRTHALAALEAARTLSMPEYVGAAQGHLAWLAWRCGDLDECVRAANAALETWRAGQPYPLQWSARLPLLAAHLQQGRLRHAFDCVAGLLDPAQQRLPDALAVALQNVTHLGRDEVVEGCGGADGQRGEGGDARLRAALERSVAMAEAAHLL